MEVNMIPTIFEDKPINGKYILIDTWGDINNPMLSTPKENWVAKDITNISCTVYNIQTDRMSSKSAYLGKNNELYLKSKDGRLYLKDFI